MRPMAKETHIKTDKNPLTAGVLGSYYSGCQAKQGCHLRGQVSA